MHKLKNAVLTAYNAVDYPLRNFIAFQRGVPALRENGELSRFSQLSTQQRIQAREREKQLVEDYRIKELFQDCAGELYLKNLYYLDLIDKAFQKFRVALAIPLHAADVGPSHWFYVRALQLALTWWGTERPRKLFLTGYEPDAYRVYSDFYSRFDHAQAHLEGTSGVEYVPETFSKQPKTFGFIGQFFPFIFLEDHLQWGLPRRQFDPLRLLQDVWESLSVGGYLLIVNQGEREHEEQLRLLEKLSLQPLGYFSFRSPFYQYQHPSQITLLEKKPA